MTEIANALGLSKAVVYRILSSFRVKGSVELDETTRRYSLGETLPRPRAGRRFGATGVAAYLEVWRPAGAEVVQLSQDEVTMGKDSRNVVCVDFDRSVSRQVLIAPGAPLRHVRHPRVPAAALANEAIKRAAVTVRDLDRPGDPG